MIFSGSNVRLTSSEAASFNEKLDTVILTPGLTLAEVEVLIAYRLVLGMLQHYKTVTISLEQDKKGSKEPSSTS